MIEEGQKKKNKTPIILMILGLLIIVLSGGFLLITNKNLKKEAPTPTPEPTLEPTPEPTPESTPKEEIKRNGKKLTLYHLKGVTSDECILEDELPEDNEKYKIIGKYQVTCVTEECEIPKMRFSSFTIPQATAHNDDFALLKDGNTFDIINFKTDELLERFDNIQSGDFKRKMSSQYIDENIDEPSSHVLLHTTDDKSGVYDCNKRKFTVPIQDIKFKEAFQSELLPTHRNVFGKGWVAIKNDKYGVINYTTGKTIFDFEYDDFFCYKTGVTYTNNENTIDYCKAKKDGKYEIIRYDNTKNQLKNMNVQVNDLYGVDKNYAYISKDNQLQLVNVETMEVIQTFDNFNPNGEAFYMGAGDKEVHIQFRMDKKYCTGYHYKRDTREASVMEEECAGVGNIMRSQY